MNRWGRDSTMNDRGFYIPVLSGLTLTAFVLLIRFFPDVTSWKLCEPARCTVQDWLSATAGWVGFVAAAVGAFFVFSQLAEQRKQTAYLMGDRTPNMMAGFTTEQEGEFLDYLPYLEVTVINQNRRPLYIKCAEFAWSDNRLDAFVDSWTINGTRTNQIIARQIRVKTFHINIDGKEEGQVAPRCVIRFHISQDGELREYPRDADLLRDVHAKIRLRGELRDTVNKPIILDAETSFSL